MANNVVGLNGEFKDDRVASAECVMKLEELLEQARSGEIVGFTYAAFNHDSTLQNGGGGQYPSYAMLGCLHHLMAGILCEKG